MNAIDKLGKKLNVDFRDSSMKEIMAFSMLPFGLLTIQTMLNTFLNIYITDVLGLSAKALSLVLLISKIWDGFNDPLMGLFVDKTRTKWGKSRPYLLWFVFPVMFVVIFLFAPINFGSVGDLVFIIIAYIMFDTFYTALDIANQSLVPLVFPDNRQRVTAISFSNIIGSIGTILPSVLFYVIVGFFGSGQQAQKKGFFTAAIFFAVLSGLPILYAFFHIKEKVYIRSAAPKYRKVLKMVFSDKKMIVLVVVAFFSAIPNLGAIFLPYFTKWNMAGVFQLGAGKTSEAALFPILNIMSGASYMLSMAIVPMLLKKMDKKTLFIRMSLIFAVADVLTFFIGVYVVPYNTAAGFVVYTLLRFFTNFPIGMSLVLLTAIFSDAIDAMEMKTGERLEGAVFSFKSLVTKLSTALFNVAVLSTLDWLGYNAPQMMEKSQNATQALPAEYKTVLNAIFFMLTGLSAIGLVAQALPMLFYRFDEKRYEKELQEFRAKKDREVEEEIARARESREELAP